MKLSLKFEKIRLYFDNSLFPRDDSLRVMDADLKTLDEKNVNTSDQCKVFKDLFTAYDRCHHYQKLIKKSESKHSSN